MSETAKTLQRWDCHHEYIEKVEGNEWGDWVSYDDAAKLLAEVERLREALRWYADPATHVRLPPTEGDPAYIWIEEPPVFEDGGKRARDALKD